MFCVGCRWGKELVLHLGIVIEILNLFMFFYSRKLGYYCKLFLLSNRIEILICISLMHI